MKPVSAREYTASIDRIDDDEATRLENRFFHQVWVSNDTAKTTAPGRLDDFNARIIECMPRGSATIHCLDAGASSGITTLDWHKSLAAADIPHSMTAIDLAVHARLFKIPGGYVMTDSADRPLQYEIAGRCIQQYKGEGGAGSVARRIVLAGLGRSFRLLKPMARLRSEFDLLAREVRRSDAIEVLECDLMRARQLGRSFDCIRAANVLNRRYFDDAFLARALKELAACLNEGGLLAVVRSEDETSTNRGSIYRLEQGAFEVLATLNDGSEIDDLVHQLRIGDGLSG